MKITTYFDQARAVAIYPESAQFYYPTLGLVGEFGELLAKIERHGFALDPDDFTYECGDCLWYVVNTTLDLDFTPDELIDKLTGGARADDFTELATLIISRHIAGGGDPLVPLGRIAEIAKKSIRDSDRVVSDEKKQLVLEDLALLVVILVHLCRSFKVNFDDVAQMNITKLFSRRERGVLGGSGDNR